MLAVSKNMVLDEQNNPIAVQIAIDDFKRLEEAFENYGLAKLMDETANDETLSVGEAKAYYESLKCGK